MRKTLLSLFLLFLCSYLRAQHKLPSLDFVPQSPTAAAFSRYGDIPVDLSTGVPNISIPIYTLSSHGINVPISLSYHASGIKVQDVSGPVGLGWTLNAGGVITRTELGVPDERVEKGLSYRPPYKNTAEFSAWAEANKFGESRTLRDGTIYEFYLNKVVFDYYSDRFYYNLGTGETGIFRKDFETDVIKLIPYRPLKVKPYWVDNKIEITSSDGTLYEFVKNSFDQWNLAKIVNSAKTDSVRFYWHTEQIGYWNCSDMSYFNAYGSLLGQRYEGALTNTGNTNCPTTMEMRLMTVEERFPSVFSGSDFQVLMDSIVSSNSVVRFSYLTDRTDYRLLGDRDYEGAPKSRLSKIQVFSEPGNVLIKEVNFAQSYFGDQADYLTKRLRLDKVDVGSNREEKYSFKYHGYWLPPYPAGDNNRFYEDFWGYYNGSHVFNSNRTNLYNEFTSSGEGNLFPNEEGTRACVLEEIQYPTGGKTVFEYESNRVGRQAYSENFKSPNVPADGKVGGLRVKKISNYAYDGAAPQVKTYLYSPFFAYSDYRELNTSKFAYQQKTFYDFYIEAGLTACAGYNNSFFASRNVCYDKPMGYVIGTAEALVIYTSVTEVIGEENNPAGKTIYAYEEQEYENFNDEPRFQGPFWRDRGIYTPQLFYKGEYKFENGVYKLVRSTNINYSTVQQSTFLTGYNVASDIEFYNLIGPPSDAFHRFNNDPYNMGLGQDYYETLHLSDCKAYTGLVLPSRTEVRDYVDNNHYVITTTDNEYNNYGQLISTNVTTSKGDVLKTKITYPSDYSTLAPYSTMVERNILSPVIEQSTYKSTTTPEIFLQSQKNNYNYWDPATQTWGNTITNQIFPQNVETKKGTNDPEIRIQYYSYDNQGNPVYFSKENDVRQLLIWSYNRSYPVAQVTNVPAEEKNIVSYTSFENNDKGNWLISGKYSTVFINPAPTGKKCLLLEGTPFNRTVISQNLDAGTSYILSYWKENIGMVNVDANYTILDVKIKGGWTYTKMKITGSGGVTITGNCYIDELRLYPESAQMTTFAYEPGVGVTAQCDINDRITYYNYDASGRVTLIKDDNGNVLKKICYNFQGQPDNCGENALPLWQETGATRCKPCPENGNYITNIKQKEERDNNPNSATYGNARWVDAGTWSNCVIQPDWQNTSNTRCVILNGQNTGEQERQQTDANPCSSYGQTRWVSAGTNTTACPLPSVFLSLAINKNYYKQNCGPQQIPLPYLVNIAEGAFTSPNSAAEANTLAEQEAQRQANANGGCTTIYVRLTKENITIDGNVAIVDFTFRFYSDAAGTVPVSLPSSLTINYYYGGYDLVDGEKMYENYDLRHDTVNGVNNFSHNVMLYNCVSENYCYYNNMYLAPGRYVILP